MVLLAAAPAGAQGHTVSLSLNIPALRLSVFLDGALEGVYPVAAGRPATPTPRGVFHVANKLVDPWWFPPDGGDPVRPGPDNPLGGWWLGLNLPGYGLHGTNNEASIGGWVSRGCVRLYNRDVAKLFSLVGKGTAVTISYHTAVVEAGGRQWAYGETGLTLLGEGLPEQDSFRLRTYPDVYGRAPLSPGALAELLGAGGLELAGDELAWLAQAGPVDFNPGAVVRFNGWEIGRGRLATARGAWLPWDVAASALGLVSEPPPGETATLAGQTWVTIDHLRREAGFSFDFSWSDGSADFAGVAVALEGRFLTGAAFLGEGVVHVLASALDPGRERVFLPIRPLAAVLGREVEWDAGRRTVFLR